MNGELEQRLREVLHDDAAGARLVNPDRPADPDARSVPGAEHPARSRRRLVAAAAVLALFAAAGGVLFENARDRDTKVTTSPDPADSTTVTTDAGFTTANLFDAVENGDVPAELRLDNVVVTVQCAHTRMSIRADLTRREVMLGGVVTANPDGVAMIDGVDVAVGDLLALVVREDDRGNGIRMRTLYHPSLWYGDQASEHTGSCTELVESVPDLDPPFFDTVGDSYRLEID